MNKGIWYQVTLSAHVGTVLAVCICQFEVLHVCSDSQSADIYTLGFCLSVCHFPLYQCLWLPLRILRQYFQIFLVFQFFICTFLCIHAGVGVIHSLFIYLKLNVADVVG